MKSKKVNKQRVCGGIPQPWMQMTLCLGLAATLAQGQARSPEDILAKDKAAATETVASNRAAKIDLAMERFLGGEQLFATAVEDAVWDLRAETGRMLVLVPVLLEPESKPVEYDMSVIKLRGGRFIAWRLSPEVSASLSASAAPAGGYGPMGPGGPPPGYDGEGGPPPGFNPGGGYRPPGGGGVQFGAAPAPASSGPLSSDIPRLARSFTLDPDGTVRWPLERYIPSATVREIDNIFCLKIKPDFLIKREPRPPQKESGGAGETAQARIDRTRRQVEAGEQYRQQKAAVDELRKTAMAAPLKFDMPHATMVWAIVEIPSGSAKDLVFEGPAPLPWQINQSQLESVRTLMRTPASTTPSPDTLGHLHKLAKLIMTDQHPFTLRAAALGMAGSKLIPLAQPGDSIYDYCKMILDSTDNPARSTIIRELVSVSPATSVSLELLKRAARNNDPATQLLALRGLARAGQPEPEEMRLLLDTANHLLSHANLMPAPLVLQELFETGRPLPAAPGTAAPPTAAGTEQAAGSVADVLSKQLSFKFADPKRSEECIAALILKNNSEALASAWLDRKVLGSGDPDLTRQALTLLAEAEIAFPLNLAEGTQPGAYGPPGGIMLGMPPGGYGAPAPTGTEAVVGAYSYTQGKGRLILHQPILLSSGNHALFTLLKSENAATRQLAWKALLACGFPAMETTNVASPYQAMSEVMGAINPIPETLVDFMWRQPNTAAGNAVLIRLAGLPDAAASTAAAQKLFGCNRPLEQAVSGGLNLDDCLKFAQKIYAFKGVKSAPKAEATAPAKPEKPKGADGKPGASDKTASKPVAKATGSQPPIVDLMRDRAHASQLAGWFLREVSLGHVPTNLDWAQAAGGEGTLVPLLMTSDEDLGLATTTALLAMIDGPPELAKPWADSARGQTNRSPEFAQGLWAKFKQEAFTARLKTSAGAYRLTLKVYPVELGGGGATMGPPPGYGGPPPGYGMDYDPSMMPGGGGYPMAQSSVVPMLPPPQGKPEIVESLGVMKLEADGKKVGFANQAVNIVVPDTALMLRIEKPAELKNFPNPKMAGLPLERLTNPVDLVPQSDGTWLARFRMIDDRMVEILMQPVPMSELPSGKPGAAKPPAPTPGTTPAKPAPSPAPAKP